MADAKCYDSVVAANMYQAMKQAMQDLIAPQLESLRGAINAVDAKIDGLRAEMRGELSGVHGELRGVHGEMNGVRAEMNGVRAEMNGVRGEINGLRAEMQSLRGEMTANVVRLDERLTLALDLRERIVALEARLPR